MQLVENLRRVWRRLVGGTGEQKPPTEPDRQSPGPESAEAAAPTKADEESVDDLTAIRGIGMATQKRLITAGIKSYTQLARAAPEDVRRALGDPRRVAKVEEWIRQARELAP